jgi:hypothetical protein
MKVYWEVLTALGKQRVYHLHHEHDCMVSSIWISVISLENKRSDCMITWTARSEGREREDGSVELLQDSNATTNATLTTPDHMKWNVNWVHFLFGVGKFPARVFKAVECKCYFLIFTKMTFLTPSIFRELHSIDCELVCSFHEQVFCGAKGEK